MIPLLSVCLCLLAQAQQPQPPPILPQTYPLPAATDESGYEAIFDGKSLGGWEGDPKYSRVGSRAPVGGVTARTLLKNKSFLIWRRCATTDVGVPIGYPFACPRQS